jgi:hypothetical protein
MMLWIKVVHYLLEYPMSPPRRARGLGCREASMPFSVIILASDMKIEHNNFEIVEGCARRLIFWLSLG